MLAILSQFKSPALNKTEITKSPYFEILLFKTRLRFRNPPRNLEDTVNLFGYKGYDKRPFVNTVSRQNYLCEEEIGLCYETLYTTGWKFFPKGWFKPAYASLSLDLVAHAVVSSERDKFPDLFQPEDSRAWILQKYHRLYQLYNEMTMVQSGNDFELVFNDPEWAKKQAEKHDFQIEPININGLSVFKGRPEPDKIDFFIAFSPEDILQFTFKLKALQPLDIDEKKDFLGRASAWVDSIMQSLELELNRKKLGSGKTSA